MKWVLTDDKLADKLLDHPDVGLDVLEVVGIAATGDSFANAGDALVSFEKKEQEIPAADVRLLTLNDHRPEIRDFHSKLRCQFAGAEQRAHPRSHIVAQTKLPVQQAFAFLDALHVLFDPCGTRLGLPGVGKID